MVTLRVYSNVGLTESLTNNAVAAINTEARRPTSDHWIQLFGQVGYWLLPRTQGLHQNPLVYSLLIYI